MAIEDGACPFPYTPIVALVAFSGDPGGGTTLC